MKSSSILALAREIARIAHNGQIEELTGEPYIRHVERVAALVDGDETKTVAWLHDVIEDTGWTLSDLQRFGMPESVLEAVELLSRPKVGASVQPYILYIGEIKGSGNPLVLPVKIADLRDHLSRYLPERRRPRYERAWRELTDEALPQFPTAPSFPT